MEYRTPYHQQDLGGFKPPQPAADWTGVRDAVKKGAICPQFTAEDSTSVRSEDCLLLNVFTPDVNASLPVFVWIHGGGYKAGSAFNDGDGATIAPHGVVTVTVNYRLGPLGFLSTGDDVMPGNYGMLDQVLALKWVQKYIRAFGGDPDQVTIGGESAGAHSVSLLTLSPLAKGLFHRVILESGSALALTAVERPGRKANVTSSTLRSASRVGCDKKTSSEILQCLQSVDVDELMNATRDAITVPRIETTFGFLPDFPINLLKSGKYNLVDTLRGRNSGENSGSVHDPQNDGVTRQEFVDVVSARVGDLVNSEAISKLLVEAYLGNETDPIVARKNLIDAVADISFGAGIMVEIGTFAPNFNITTAHYLYEFDYRMSGTSTPAWQGVAHAAERRFVFYPDSRYHYGTPTDKAVGETTQRMWVNFIKYGNPTPPNISPANSLVSWNSYTQITPNILKIDAKNTLVTYPRPYIIPLYEKILEIVKSDIKINSPVVG